MAEGYIGEIRLFATARNQAPANWLFCDGSLVSVVDYQVLFAVIGTTYGGDGLSTFGLPDYRSRLPIGAGSNGTNTYNPGDKGGLEQVPLTGANMPGHTHQWFAATANATTTDPTNAMFAAVPMQTIGGKPVGGLYEDTANSAFTWCKADASVIAANGTSGVTHENRMPIMAISFIICYQGIYPVRG